MKRAIVLPLLAALTALSAGAAGRELAPRVLAPTAYHADTPHTAFAGDRFLTVWSENMNILGTPVMAAFSDASGRRISPRAFPLALPESTSRSSLQLVGTGDSFALFWFEPGQGTLMADIDLEGRVTAVRAVAALQYRAAFTFAWNDVHFLAVYRHGSSAAEAALFERDGQLVRDGIALPHATTEVDVVVLGREFVVLTNGPAGLFLQMVSENGIGRRRTLDESSGGSSGRYYPHRAIATLTPSGEVLIVWSDGARERRYQLKAAVFENDDDGTVTQLPPLAEHEAPILPLGVLNTGDGHVVAFASEAGNRWSFSTVRFTASGATPAPPVRFDSLSVAASAAWSSNGSILLLTSLGVISVTVGADGQPRAPEVLSLGYSHQSQPILGAGGGNVLAAWTESANGASAVRAALVTPAGEPLPAAHVAPGTIATQELAWSGTYHLVLQRDGRRLTAMRISADGRAVDKEPIFLAEIEPWAQYLASAVWTGEQWVVAWTTGSRLRAARISASGIPSAARSLPLQLAPVDYPYREVHAPLLAFDGEHVLVLWTEISSAPCQIAPPCPFIGPRRLALLLTPDGKPTDDVPFELPAGAGTSIATSGSEFLILDATRATVVVKRRNRLRFAAMREVFNYPATSDVTWDGRDYVIALRYRGANWYLALQRVDRDLNEVAETRGTRTLGPDQFVSPSVAAPFHGHALIGLQEGTPADGVRAVVYRESDLAPLPSRPDAPRNVRVHPLGRESYEVTWEPSANAEVYQVEALGSDGGWHWIGGTDAGTHQAIVFWTNVRIRVRAFNAAGASEAGYPG